MAVLKLTGRIENVVYTPSIPLDLPLHHLDGLNVNNHKAILVSLDETNRVALSRWTGPKRTRTYPFASVYDTYGFNGKRITVIPIIKDEGSDTNNDRINHITLSWMNLLNIYIILAWYEDADKKSESRITNQSLNNEWVIKKVKEISSYQLDAHHWNTQHFTEDFSYVLNEAVESYERISRELNVKLHDSKLNYENFIHKFINPNNKAKIDLSLFAQSSLERSRLAANREAQTLHELEVLYQTSDKAVFELTNTLGGKYYLTADDVFFVDGSVVIQEAKNSSRNKIPDISDIKDGLFKMILYSNLEYVNFGGVNLPTEARIRLTGSGIIGNLSLPSEKECIYDFINLNHFSKKQIDQILWLNDETRLNNFSLSIDIN